MSLTVLASPSGFQPVGSEDLIYSFQESTLSGKINYRVELEFVGLFNGLKFEFRPDADLRIDCNISNILSAALTLSTDVHDRMKRTFIRYQAVWNASSDAQVSLSNAIIHFYAASNNYLNYRYKRDISRSSAASNKFLVGPALLKVSSGRTAYIEWLQTISQALTLNGTAVNMSVPDNGSAIKVAGGDGWNAQVYSTQSYTQNCRLKFRYDGGDVSVALSESPSANADQTGFKYSMNLIAGADVDTFVNLAAGQDHDYAVTPGEICEIIYDGVNVKYYYGRVLLRTEARAVGAAFYMDSSFHTVGTSISEIEFTEYVTWNLSSANITRVFDNEFKRTAGTAEQVTSAQGYTSEVYCSATCTSTTRNVAFGLNSDPNTDSLKTSLDYCWQFETDGSVKALVAGATYYTAANGVHDIPASIFSIVYSIDEVKFYVNDVLVINLARVPDATVFYFDSAFADNATLSYVEYGPVPPLTKLNYNNGSDTVIVTQEFKGTKMTFESVSYTGFTLDGTLTVKEVGTDVVFSTLLLDVLTECTNPLYLRWINSYGGLSTWMFDHNQNLAFSLSNYTKFMVKSVKEDILSYEDWLMLNELIKSGTIYNDDYKLGMFVQDITTLATPINVVMLEIETETNNRKYGHQLTLGIKYPALYNNKVTQ